MNLFLRDEHCPKNIYTKAFAVSRAYSFCVGAEIPPRLKGGKESKNKLEHAHE
jgi:hypothetical protein